MDGEGRLVPILREGIEIVKVIFFKELRDHLLLHRGDWDQEFRIRVTAAVVNELFGVINEEEGFMAFVGANGDAIDQVRSLVGRELAPLRIPLTDALRTMVLCDYHEGRDTSALLQQAQECGVLIAERDLPLPNTFIDLVRRLGQAKGVLQPPAAAS
jgi:hypothetical protein